MLKYQRLRAFNGHPPGLPAAVGKSPTGPVARLRGLARAGACNEGRCPRNWALGALEDLSIFQGNHGENSPFLKKSWGKYGTSMGKDATFLSEIM